MRGIGRNCDGVWRSVTIGHDEAGGERMSGEEVADGHPAGALELDFGDDQSAGAASDAESGAVGVQEGAGCPGQSGLREGRPDLEEPGVGWGAEVGEGAGPGVEGADASGEVWGGLAPIEPAVFLDDFAGVGNAVGGLGARGEASSEELGDGSEEELRAGVRQSVVEGRGGFRGTDRCAFESQDIAGVEAGIHFHEGDAGDGVSVEDGPLDWGGSAVAGEEGPVDIEATVWGQFEEGWGEDLAVGSDDDQVGMQRAELLDEGRLAATRGLEHWETEVEGQLLGGAGTGAEVTADLAVGLGDQGEELGLGTLGEGSEAGARKGGGAEEDNPGRVCRGRDHGGC